MRVESIPGKGARVLMTIKTSESEDEKK